MSATPRTDKEVKEWRSWPIKGNPISERFARQLETELVNKDRQLTDAQAKIERLHTQCDIIKDIERHRVHEWYYGKLSALHAWAKIQPESISKPIFSCLANGAPSIYDCPEHSQRLNGLKIALEQSEQKLADRNKLIEQMLGALKSLRQWIKAEVEHFGAAEPDDHILAAVDAAIEAGEGNGK